MFMWTLGTWRSLCELQVWKFPKGFNVRDLKAHVEAKPEPLLPVGLPGEVTPSETGHKTRVSERSDASTDSFSSAASRGNTSGRRASLLLPGRRTPNGSACSRSCTTASSPSTSPSCSGSTAWQHQRREEQQRQTPCLSDSSNALPPHCW